MVNADLMTGNTKVRSWLSKFDHMDTTIGKPGIFNRQACECDKPWPWCPPCLGVLGVPKIAPRLMEPAPRSRQPPRGGRSSGPAVQVRPSHRVPQWARKIDRKVERRCFFKSSEANCILLSLAQDRPRNAVICTQ
jgi:hypothetical protein